MRNPTFAVIDSIEVEDYEGAVYNLQTGAEEYVVAGVVVHNCPHAWMIHADKVTAQTCEILWMGE